MIRIKTAVSTALAIVCAGLLAGQPAWADRIVGNTYELTWAQNYEWNGVGYVNANMAFHLLFQATRPVSTVTDFDGVWCAVGHVA